MVITEHKKMEACKLVVMGADREQIHEMRIAMMAALEGLKEDATALRQALPKKKRAARGRLACSTKILRRFRHMFSV